MHHALMDTSPEGMTGPERQATTTALLALARVIDNRQDTSEEGRA